MKFLKFAPVFVLAFAFGQGDQLVPTGPASASAQTMATCYHLHGRERRLCQALRAEREAIAQMRGEGRRLRGKGPKYYDCLAKARRLRLQEHSAPRRSRVSYQRDC